MNSNHLSSDDYFWVLQSICTLYRKPYSDQLARAEFIAPYHENSLKQALHRYGFDSFRCDANVKNISHGPFPIILFLASPQNKPHHLDEISTSKAADNIATPALILQANQDQVLYIERDDAAPRQLGMAEFLARCPTGALSLHPIEAVLPEEDASNVEAGKKSAPAPFGFHWFVPELLKHKRLWQEILLASLVMQLIALATPLFTQTIIDKVIVHHTQSTLIVIATGMAAFLLFSAGLSWLRQYMVLHTGNRVDAVLGAAVFAHLFKLPVRYFQSRPTGVIAARLHGVESIREFIASTAITLLLDLPFLLIFVGIMFYYNVTLTLIVLAVLLLIGAMSLMIAPLFQARLQHQFQLGARNQALLTEYVVGLETVKSLQLEPQLIQRYEGFLASSLSAGFATKQLANTYNVTANLLEQVMGLLILVMGAWSVMHSTEFTIGMLVAFQMFSGRLTQPVLRIVGLWQQFQQARLSVARLGDVMDAPVEPYSVIPARGSDGQGDISIEEVGFQYAAHLPMVYQGLNLSIEAGKTVGIIGASGCGKSTLAKLLQGFYQPSMGRIVIDGIDIRYLSANELRSYFGVVPQETVLFSGTIYDNLQMANPQASFDMIVFACKMAEIHSVIEALPQGYQTEIGERGAGLSGGQKQRIAIARALLKRPRVLIFDEATSALDGLTSEDFAKTINALHGKVSMLFITHAMPRGLQLDAVYRLGPQGAQRIGLSSTPTASTPNSPNTAYAAQAPHP